VSAIKLESQQVRVGLGKPVSLPGAGAGEADELGGCQLGAGADGLASPGRVRIGLSSPGQVQLS
jgi:hypothetical protein